MCDNISSAQALSVATSSLYRCATFDAVVRSALSQTLSKYFVFSVMMNTYFIRIKNQLMHN
jgi:hypothetical protein